MLQNRIARRLVTVVCIALASSACSTLPEPAPTPTRIAMLDATATATEITMTPTQTRTVTPTTTPSFTPTSTFTLTPRPSATSTPTLRRIATPTKSPTPGPTSTPSNAQICATVAAKGQIGIYVMYLRPTPDLVWDTTPRQFKVGLCNTIPRSSTPQGKYKIVLNFPGSNHGSTESSFVRAELAPGLNEVSVGPWVPGLENHIANCMMRAVGETQVMYNDTPDPIYHALPWLDGSDRTSLRIQCGGNFP